MEFDLNRFTEIADEAAQKWIIPRLGGKRLIVLWEMNRGRRWAGFCRKPEETEGFGAKITVRISLSKYYVAINDEDGVKEIIYHELAHVIHFNHSYEFKLLLSAMLGYRVGRTVTEKVTRIQEGGYLYRCPNGHEFRFFRRLGRELSCFNCHRGFDRRFLIQPVDSSIIPPRGRLYRCPNGHERRFFRKLTRLHSCPKCYPVFDRRFLMTEVQEYVKKEEFLEDSGTITRTSELLEEENPQSDSAKIFQRIYNQEPKTVVFPKFGRGQYLGSGGYGCAYSLSGNRILKLTSSLEEAQTMDVLSKLPHPNIVRVFGVWKIKSSLYLILRSKAIGQIVSESKYLDIFRQAIDYIDFKQCMKRSRPQVGRQMKSMCYQERMNPVLYRQFEQQLLSICHHLKKAGIREAPEEAENFDIGETNMVINNGKLILFDLMGKSGIKSPLRSMEH